MKLIRGGTLFAVALVTLMACTEIVRGQALVDTMRLTPLPPDSIYVRAEGRTIVVGWYPPLDSIASVTGSRDYSLWRTEAGVSEVGYVGFYRGAIDRQLRIEKLASSLRDTVGTEPSIEMLAQVEDRRDVYRKVFNLGSNYYAAGDTVWLALKGQATGDTLDLGIGLVFGPGIVPIGGNIVIDLQTYEGFHVWRGLSTRPSEMIVVSELSREDAFIGVERDSIYFRSWPRLDGHGRPYYEYVDENVFPGFTYYIVVSTFDKGYFKGSAQHNKEDNFICDEDPSEPRDPLHPVPCETVAERIYLTVAAGTDISRVYAVPNPFRTGTSAETSPFYHNYPDEGIRFFNVPRDSELQIFTVAGDLIRELSGIGARPEDGVIAWDVKNKHGQSVGSGVYIYRIKAKDGSDMYGRLVVIR